MSITIRTSNELLHHLANYEVDGTTVARALFVGGRLFYPGRDDLELQLKYKDPYTLEHEARVVLGIPGQLRLVSSIRLLAAHAPVLAGPELDGTLDLLWSSHASWCGVGVALDRIVAAMVATQFVVQAEHHGPQTHLEEAALLFIEGMREIGFPLTKSSLEELFDGAEPACSGLGLVEI